MKNIWLVIGGTGDYSDYEEWVVCGYSTEQEAQKHCDALQAFADTCEHLDYKGRVAAKTPSTRSSALIRPPSITSR